MLFGGGAVFRGWQPTHGASAHPAHDPVRQGHAGQEPVDMPAEFEPEIVRLAALAETGGGTQHAAACSILASGRADRLLDGGDDISDGDAVGRAREPVAA